MFCLFKVASDRMGKNLCQLFIVGYDLKHTKNIKKLHSNKSPQIDGQVTGTVLRMLRWP